MEKFIPIAFLLSGVDAFLQGSMRRDYNGPYLGVHLDTRWGDLMLRAQNMPGATSPERQFISILSVRIH